MLSLLLLFILFATTGGQIIRSFSSRSRGFRPFLESSVDAVILVFTAPTKGAKMGKMHEEFEQNDPNTTQSTLTANVTTTSNTIRPTTTKISAVSV